MYKILLIIFSMLSLSYANDTSILLWSINEQELKEIIVDSLREAERTGENKDIVKYQALLLAHKEREIMRSIKLIVFKKESCQYCQKQMLDMDKLIKRLGWNPFEIIDIEKEPMKASQYNIETVPTTMVRGVISGQKIESNVAVGKIDDIEMEKVILTAYKKWFKGE